MEIENPETSFNGEITVASRIIDYLSSGLYKDPASCMKELINNSYDADATRVDIFVKPDADRIIIEDDGVGISKDEFTKHFKRISESHKRDETEITKSGRKKIGKIGIGFIAANEICDEMEVFSTKEGSDELLHVTINFADMRKPAQDREDKSGDVTKADYIGEILKEEKNSHYTQIFLKYVRGDARDILAGATAQKEEAKAKSLYGLEPKSIEKVLKKEEVREWKVFDAYSETMLKVALNIPVKYHDNWIPNKSKKIIKEFEESVKNLGFDVYYDGTELRKPTVYDPGDKSYFVDTFDYEGKHVSAKGYFYVQHGTIKPFDLHGVLIRIRHSAVDGYRQQFLEFPTSEHGLIQRWVSCEIWADDKLEDAMNIDRGTLRDTHPAYVELRRYFHSRLREVLKKAKKELYEKGSKTRREEKIIETYSALNKIIDTSIKSTDLQLANDLKKNIKKYKNDEIDERILSKKYSVVEMYEIVIDSAKESLTPSQFSKFMKALTKRLGD